MCITVNDPVETYRPVRTQLELTCQRLTSARDDQGEPRVQYAQNAPD